jgi:hypothetical protein
LNTTFNNPEEDYFNGDDPPKESPETLEVTEKLLDRILNRPPDADIIDYAIHKQDTDELIGCGMIARINHYNRRCDLGIGIIGGKAMPAKPCKPSLPIVSMNYTSTALVRKSTSSTNARSDCSSGMDFAAKASFASIFLKAGYSRMSIFTVC